MRPRHLSSLLATAMMAPWTARAQTGAAATATGAEALDGLRDRVEKLESANRRLEQRLEEDEEKIAAGADRSVFAGGLPGTFEIPGTGISMGFGGYVKLDLIVSSSGRPTEAEGVPAPGGDLSEQFVVPGLIPIDGPPPGEATQLYFHPRESRIWWRAHSPTDWGDFNAYIELDFFAFQSPGNETISNSYAPRMRHAFGALGPLLAGQTWTTFMNVSAIPENLDFVGTVGTIFARQPMIRWTQPFGESFDLQIALEQPETTITTVKDSDALQNPGDDRIPDVVLGAKYAGDFGNVTLTMIGRQLRVDDGARSDEHYAGGASFAGRLYTFGRDNVRFTINGGTGLGRYLALGAVTGGYETQNDVLEGTLPSMSGHVAYQHHWSDHFRSSATFSFFQAFFPGDLLREDVTEQAIGTYINLLYSPIPRTTFGIEGIHARRELRDGRSGTLFRGQISAKFVL